MCGIGRWGSLLLISGAGGRRCEAFFPACVTPCTIHEDCGLLGYVCAIGSLLDSPAFLDQPKNEGQHRFGSRPMWRSSLPFLKSLYLLDNAERSFLQE